MLQLLRVEVAEAVSGEVQELELLQPCRGVDQLFWEAWVQQGAAVEVDVRALGSCA